MTFVKIDSPLVNTPKEIGLLPSIHELLERHAESLRYTNERLNELATMVVGPLDTLRARDLEPVVEKSPTTCIEKMHALLYQITGQLNDLNDNNSRLEKLI